MGVLARNKLGERTKEKILQAALAEFLDKGFDRGKVEDIAKRAGLTKMMLYYHFSSKENIMSELMAEVFTEVKEKFRENLSNLDTGDPNNIRTQIELMLDYFYEKKDVIRLISSESLKVKNESMGSLSVLEELFKTISTVFAEGASEKSGRDQFLVKVFFFNALPMIMYSSLSDKFNSDFSVDPEKSRTVFVDTFINVFYGNHTG